MKSTNNEHYLLTETYLLTYLLMTKAAASTRVLK